MNIEKPKLKGIDLVLAVGIAATVGNYISAKYVGFPFLHCWLSPMVWPLYEAVGQILSVCLMVYFVWCLIRGALITAATVALVWVVITSLPQFTNTLFKLGGSCG